MSFMVPEVANLTRAEAAEYIEHEQGDEPGAGFYSRLQAPGYLDATDWSGPFKTEAEALNYLVETYDLCTRCKEEDALDDQDLCESCFEVNK